MNILIIGRTEMLYETIKLLARKHQIVGIISAQASPEYAKKLDDFELLAEELGCPFLFTTKLDDEAVKFIQSIDVEIAVSINWVSVIGLNIISLIPKGILNAHFGDLPLYRGNAVINWALLRHETTITLTIHFMQADELDSGDVLLKKTMSLSPTTTIKEVVEFAKDNIPVMFLEVVNSIETNAILPISQNTSTKIPFRCYPRLPVDSKINWNYSSKDIDALIRASTRPYSGAYSFIKIKNELKKIYFWSSRIVYEDCNDIGVPGHVIKNDATTGESWIFTGKGILGISLAQYDGSDIDFRPGNEWKSIRLRFGIDLEEEIIGLYQQINKISNTKLF